MVTFDIGERRRLTKMLAPSADFDGAYTFYYDETNNIRKFYVRELDFNSAFTDNFILGGLVHEGPAPDVQPLIDSFKLQSSVKEVKLKHIAKGDFLDCLKSQKLNIFLKYISTSHIYIHYSSLNILYWSIVDIVDSAISHSEASQQLGIQFANALKNDLYKLARIEIDSVISLFHKYEYPNIKPCDVILFIEDISDLFEKYLDDMEFHFGLESLRQLLKEAKRNGSLPFVMDEENFVLIKDFSQFYLRPIYLFKNATHIFDNEESIAELLSGYKILDGLKEVKNYSFVDSESCQLTQLSDILVGLIGKMHGYINSHPRDEIHTDFNQLNSIQSDNISLLLDLIDRSHEKNIGFLHSTDSYEEMSKIEVIRASRIEPRA
ncbi:DUF3800 domain-containing protein [Thiomicrorhabdus sp.]|uniref:DUF3800 domain-containing protein n=1 Tax=Thiomicrorhabdus sp. TaxID=2039724 RepID=UPI002AA6E7B8|nr:DUF3800 domain-containing protein [Thiomicrorhabdus sp.]